MSPSADRNLLFGILALQMDFISRDAVIAGMHAWVLDKTRLCDILVEQNACLAMVHDRLPLRPGPTLPPPATETRCSAALGQGPRNSGLPAGGGNPALWDGTPLPE